MFPVPWSAILDWLQSNWLGLVTLGVVAFGAVTSWLHFRRSKRDVTPQVQFAREGKATDTPRLDVGQVGKEASPFRLRFAVVNLGGSRLKNGRLTITLPGGLKALDSDGWESDVPNALVAGGSAVAHELPKLGRNERHETPPLTVHHPDLRREGGSYSRGYRLRWEVWSGQEGLGSDDLKVRFKIDAP